MSPGFLLFWSLRKPELDAHPALPKSGVAPSFRPVRDPLFGRPAKDAVVAQLVRAPVCGTGGRWFEPTQLYHKNKFPCGFSITLIDLTYLLALNTKGATNGSKNGCLS